MGMILQNSHYLLLLSLFLSFLAFIPGPDYSSPAILLHSNIVIISFACVVASSVPMMADYVVDLSAKTGIANLHISDRLHLWERSFILFGYAYPAIGYFVLLAFFPNDIGVYFTYLTNSQNVWLGGSILSTIYASADDIWTFGLTTAMIVCIGLSSALNPFTAYSYLITIVYFFLTLVYVGIFLVCYIRTTIIVRRKGFKALTSGEYFCFMYSTLILFMMVLSLIVPTFLQSYVGTEVTIVYCNFVVIVLVTLATIIPTRARQIKLENTEQSLEAKQAFVRYLSHEMRTPMNIALLGIQMHQQYLEEKSTYDNECMETLLDIKEAMNVALETLNEVLNYEKLNSRVMILDKSLEDPQSVVLSALNIFKVTAQNAGIHLQLPNSSETRNFNEALPMMKKKQIDVDIHKMGQILRNFVSNALKFTPSGGSITVALRTGDLMTLQPDWRPMKKSPEWVNSMFSQDTGAAGDSWIEISVTDTGTGIAPENLHLVFNDIVQFNPNQNHGGNGSGLGMFISKGIAELHGGKVYVHSDGLDKGTRFAVLLPLVDPPMIEQQPNLYCASLSAAVSTHSTNRFLPIRSVKVQPDHLSVEEAVENELVSRHSFRDIEIGNKQLLLDVNATPRHDEESVNQCPLQSIVPLPPPVPDNNLNRNALHGMKLLMVDDSVTNLKLCSKLFRKLGAEVDSAVDGSVAVEMMKESLKIGANDFVFGDLQKKYDLVVMDYIMPHMNGPIACEKMRQMGFNGQIIGLTGNALPEDIADYIAHGADAVLVKPLNLANLFSVLRLRHEV